MPKIGYHKLNVEKYRDPELWDKFGVYTRRFKSKSEVWPLFEHFAREKEFRLIDMKPSKRVYRFQSSTKWFSEIIEVTERDREVTLRAWLECGSLARLFLLTRSQFLSLDNNRFFAAKSTRHFTKILDGLLKRFQIKGFQPLASISFWDLNTASILNSLACLALTLVCMFVGVVHQDWNWQNFQFIIMEVASKNAVNSVLQLLMILLGVFFLEKYSRRYWQRISFVSLTLILSAFLNLRTLQKIDKIVYERKLVNSCFVDGNYADCKSYVDSLGEVARTEMQNKLKKMGF